MKKSFNFILKIATLVVAVSMLFLLASCGEKAPSAVEATSILFDGKTVSWKASDGAQAYKVQINSNSAVTVSSTTFAYTAKESDENVQVTIIASNETGDSDSSVRNFTKLTTITELEFDSEGVLSWPSVDGASSYKVKINGVETEVSTTSFSDFKLGETNRISVRPIASDGGSYSFYSKEVSKTYLAAPTNIKYDGQTLKWTGSGSYATHGYEIYVNGALHDTTTGSITSLAFDSENSSFTVSIIAKGDSGNVINTFASPMSEEVRFTYLPAIEEVRVVDGHLEWDPVAEATGYVVKIGNDERKTDQTTFEIEAGRSFNVQVKPVLQDGSVFFTSWSARHAIYVLKAPAIQWNNALELDDGVAKNNIYWDLVDGNIAGFNVKVIYDYGNTHREDIHPLGYNEKSFEYAFTNVGNYQVYVQALASANAGYYNSVWSLPINVVRLAAPAESTIKITSTPNILANGFDVTFEGVNGANGYRIYKGGSDGQDMAVDRDTLEKSCHVDQVVESTNTLGGQFVYKIQSLGTGLKSVGGQRYVYLSTLLADCSSWNIEVLATPTNVEFDGYQVSWLGDSKSGFSVELNGTNPTDDHFWKLNDLNAGGPYKFNVCAQGDGAKVLPSNPTANYSVVRLAAPTNIKIGTTGSVAGAPGDEGTISWDDVDGAVSYSIFYGSSETAAAVSQNDNIYGNISTTGTAISLTANANEMKDGIYYVTSRHSQTIQVTRFTNPVFPTEKISNGILQWNAPSNVNTQSYVPTYVIYDQDRFAFNGERGNPQFNIYENFEGGQDISLYVQAIGNGTTWVNSERYGSLVTFYLLATPNVVRVDGGYEWQGVPKALGYQVTVDGVVVAQITHRSVEETYRWNLDMSKFPQTNKTYTVAVQAIGDDNTIVDSAPAKISQFVTQATAPKYSTAYDHDYYDVNGNVVVSITTESDHTLGYYFKVGGSTSELQTNTTYMFKPNTVGELKVEVWASGSVFDSQGVLYIASEHQNTTVTLLPAPSNLAVDRDGLVTWSAVANRDYYEVVITIKGSDQKIIFNTNSTSFTLGYGNASGVTKSTFDTISIYAHGKSTSTGALVITSAAAVFHNQTY